MVNKTLDNRALSASTVANALRSIDKEKLSFVAFHSRSYVSQELNAAYANPADLSLLVLMPKTWHSLILNPKPLNPNPRLYWPRIVRADSCATPGQDGASKQHSISVEVKSGGLPVLYREIWGLYRVVRGYIGAILA